MNEFAQLHYESENRDHFWTIAEMRQHMKGRHELFA